MSNAVQKLTPTPAEPALAGTQASASATPPPTDLLDSMPWLPCTLSLEVPVARFTVGELLKLTKGSIVETACHHTSDIQLRVNRLLIGWTEFEVLGDRLAVRITDQA